MQNSLTISLSTTYSFQHNHIVALSRARRSGIPSYGTSEMFSSSVFVCQAASMPAWIAFPPFRAKYLPAVRTFRPIHLVGEGTLLTLLESHSLFLAAHPVAPPYLSTPHPNTSFTHLIHLSPSPFLCQTPSSSAPSAVSSTPLINTTGIFLFPICSSASTIFCWSCVDEGCVWGCCLLAYRFCVGFSFCCGVQGARLGGVNGGWHLSWLRRGAVDSVALHETGLIRPFRV